MLKSKRSNYLIDKPFQIGFIFRFIVIIILTIIIVFGVTALYYWYLSNYSEMKLDTSLSYTKLGQVKKEGHKVYIYEKEKIDVYEKIDNNGNKTYICNWIYQGADKKYKIGEVVENVDAKSLKTKIGPITYSTDRFKIMIFPLLLTAIVLIIVISIYSLFFSHRMAGPIYRIRVSLDRMLSGDNDFIIKVRKNDFFQNIVDKLEQLRQLISKKK